jgi:hypothetical protein
MPFRFSTMARVGVRWLFRSSRPDPTGRKAVGLLARCSRSILVAGRALFLAKAPTRADRRKIASCPRFRPFG